MTNPHPIIENLRAKLKASPIEADPKLETVRKQVYLKATERYHTECLQCGGFGHNQNQCVNRSLLYHAAGTSPAGKSIWNRAYKAHLAKYACLASGAPRYDIIPGCQRLGRKRIQSTKPAWD